MCIDRFECAAFRQYGESWQGGDRFVGPSWHGCPPECPVYFSVTFSGAPARDATSMHALADASVFFDRMIGHVMWRAELIGDERLLAAG